MADWSQLRQQHEEAAEYYRRETAKIKAQLDDAINTKRFMVRAGHWFGALRVEWLKRQGWYTVDVSPVFDDPATAPIVVGSRRANRAILDLVWVTMKRHDASTLGA